MSLTYISFNLKSIATNIESNEKLEKDFQTIYKPLIKFLFSNPQFCFSFSFTGMQIEYYKKRKCEFLTTLKQLVDRKQIEVLGGGFYDPVLPLLYTADRNGQIDKMSAEIRQSIGKRPRGISLFADSWDSSLVNNLQTCGIEYVLLDSSFISIKKHKFIPLIMSNLGKSVEILPYYDNLKPVIQSESENLNQSSSDLVSASVSEFILKIQKAIEKIEKKESLQGSVDRIVNISLSHEDLQTLIEKDWFNQLNKAISDESSLIKTITPSDYRKNCILKEPAYIAAGINGQIAKWIARPFMENESKQNILMTVYDFMETYPSSHDLYNRILYVSMLVNQFKFDKMRKNAAREKLWQAQNGTGLLCSAKGAFSNSRYRQQAYKYLMEAEKILREDNSFKESVSCFDYNGDGINEYVCRMQNYFSYINTIGGSIQELDILKNTGNYADNLSRVQEYDGCTDAYKRGIFVDHLFSEAQFSKYLSSQPVGEGVFSKTQFTTVKYSSSHHEIQFGATAYFGSTKQKVYLRKKYIINSTGMIIQYILRNESEKNLNAYFAVESNFAHTNFHKTDNQYYNLEAVDNDLMISVDTTKPISEQENHELLNNVDIVRLTDIENGISFSFEPNEKCGYNYFPIIFNRPDFNGIDMVPVHLTFVSTLYWNVNIEPGKEIEKTINFTITNVKKERKSKI